MVRKVNDRDIGFIREWFLNQTGATLHPDVLSSEGYIYEGIAALFFYPTIGCKMALVGWPIANPQSSKAARDLAFNALFVRIEREAKNAGYSYLTSYASRSSVASRLSSQGYRMGDINLIQFTKNLEV